MNQLVKVILVGTFIFFQGLALVEAQDQAAKSELQNFSQDVLLNFIKDYLKEKAKYSGKVDLYDEKINKVRNLDLMDLDAKIQQENNQYFTRAKFRDVSTGDIATIKIIIDVIGGKLEMNSLVIENIDKVIAANVPDPNKQFSDSEVQEAMLKYLKQKSQFTGTFDMFDEKIQKMRNLEIGKFEDKIRRFGSRCIGRLEAVDRSLNENLELDVSIDNKEGVLEVKSVKIYSVNKVPR